MQCVVDGCQRPAKYKAACLCQKHYFRQRRYGTTELVGPRKAGKIPTSRAMRKENAKGYQLVFMPSHPLAMRDGYVYEHRLKVHERFGEALPACEICRAPTFWENCHIDHRDEDVRNNDIANLRPVCPGCNTSRTPRSTTPRFLFEGRQMTVTELSRLSNAQVGRAQISRRIAAGMSVADAVLLANKTHPKEAA